MKTIYIAHAMTHSRYPLDDMRTLASWLQGKGVKVLQPKRHLFPEILASRAVKSMNASDLIIADLTCPSHGVGFEIGFAYATGKKVILVAKESVKADLTPFLSGLFGKIILYEASEQLIREVDDVLSELDNEKRHAGTSSRGKGSQDLRPQA